MLVYSSTILIHYKIMVNELEGIDDPYMQLIARKD